MNRIVIIIVLSVALLAMAFLWVNRPRKIIINANLPADFPEMSFSHDSFEDLLNTYVTEDGRIDYTRWHELPQSEAQLESYLAAVARYSPLNAPDRFPDRFAELAYWMYGYNAYVIKAVLERWPIESVTDVKAPIEAIKGQGFFHQQQFSFGGEYLNLLDVENDKIRKVYMDPRVHFILNCASESCPVARPGLPVGEDLDKLLALAAVDFINDPDNVSVDHQNKLVYLSKIFKWYEKDFVNDVRLDGELAGNGIIAYISKYTAPELSTDLAKAQRYKIVFRTYDWSLNSAG